MYNFNEFLCFFKIFFKLIKLEKTRWTMKLVFFPRFESFIKLFNKFVHKISRLIIISRIWGLQY